MDTDWEKFKEIALRSVKELGVIPITTDIKPELNQIVTECVFEAMLRKIKNITVLIDTKGGDIRAGIGISNTISIAAANSIEVRGLVLSAAHSSGFMVLQACKTRSACRGASLMMHWGQTSLQNDDYAAIMRGEADWVIEQIEDSRLEMLDIFAKRSGLSEQTIRQMCDREVSLYPRKALQLNLLDNLVEANEFKIPSPKDE